MIDGIHAPVLIFRSARKWSGEARDNLVRDITKQLEGTALEGVKVLVLSECDELAIVPPDARTVTQ